MNRSAKNAAAAHHFSPANSNSTNSSPRTLDILDRLRSQLQLLEHTTVSRDATPITTGYDALDDLLPTGGFMPGQIIEWFVKGTGHGGSTLALLVARAAIQSDNAAKPTAKTRSDNKVIVIMDRVESTDRQQHGPRAAFYPPAAAELGIDLRHMIVLRPSTTADDIWALDQSLRCPCVGAVWAWLPQLNDRDFRRFQLAAEEGGSLGLFMRPACLHGQPTWADTQLLVEPRPSTSPLQPRSTQQPSLRFLNKRNSPKKQSSPNKRRWLVTVLRCRGGVAGKQQLLELDETNGTLCAVNQTTDRNSATNSELQIDTGGTNHEKSPLPLAAQLAHPTAHPSANRFNQNSKNSTQNRNSA